MLTYCNGTKVGIKLLKISYVRILFLVSLLFAAVILLVYQNMSGHSVPNMYKGSEYVER